MLGAPDSRLMGVPNGMQTDDSLQSDFDAAPAEGMCLCCTTLEPPAVTLTTEFVQYLRCPSCGFIWTVRAPQPTFSAIE
jgi:hypothetical protein